MCMQGIQLSESIHNDVSEKFYDWHRNGDSEIRAKGSLVRLDEMLPDELEERSPEVSNQY